jgi:hypothetical protein
MRTGEVEANLPQLNEEARLPQIDDLIVRKLEGTEGVLLDDGGVDFHRREYERLQAELEQAHADSALPEGPTAQQGLNDLLVRLRLEAR